MADKSITWEALFRLLISVSTSGCANLRITTSSLPDYITCSDDIISINSLELREDGSSELREDGSNELREN